MDWRQTRYSIESGTHTLRWTYKKDGSVNYGSDAAWLDKVESIKIYYVCKQGCNGASPCYSTIQAALDDALGGTIIKVCEGIYSEAPDWNSSGTITMTGGWNEEFQSQPGTTQVFAPRSTNGGGFKILPKIKIISQD